MDEMNGHSSAATDADLRQLRQRAPAAVERWFHRHANPLYTFVFYRVGRDPELAAEVVQETFLAALGKIEDYDPERGGMQPWLTFVARNCIRSALRQRSRFEGGLAEWEEIDRKLLATFRDLSAAPLPDEVLERQETAELVQMALSNIPETYRRALKQHYYLGRSLAEIARSQRTTEGAVKSLLHRARLAFKAAFETIAESLERQPSTREVTS
jgi:RNA polymerase sigma-70 factor (ECF subfamily)